MCVYIYIYTHIHVFLGLLSYRFATIPLTFRGFSSWLGSQATEPKSQISEIILPLPQEPVGFTSPPRTAATNVQMIRAPVFYPWFLQAAPCETAETRKPRPPHPTTHTVLPTSSEQMCEEAISHRSLTEPELRWRQGNPLTAGISQPFVFMPLQGENWFQIHTLEPLVHPIISPIKTKGSGRLIFTLRKPEAGLGWGCLGQCWAQKGVSSADWRQMGAEFCRWIIHTLRELGWYLASKKDSFWAWSLCRWVGASRQRPGQAWEKEDRGGDGAAPTDCLRTCIRQLQHLPSWPPRLGSQSWVQHFSPLGLVLGGLLSDMKMDLSPHLWKLCSWIPSVSWAQLALGKSLLVTCDWIADSQKDRTQLKKHAFSVVICQALLWCRGYSINKMTKKQLPRELWTLWKPVWPTLLWQKKK